MLTENSFEYSLQHYQFGVFPLSHLWRQALKLLEDKSLRILNMPITLLFTLVLGCVFFLDFCMDVFLSPPVLVIMLQIQFDSFLFFLTCHQMSEQSAPCCHLLIQNRRGNLGDFSLNARWGWPGSGLFFHSMSFPPLGFGQHKPRGSRHHYNQNSWWEVCIQV